MKMKRRHALFFLSWLFCGACQRPVSGPIPQRGYLWQREWTPAVEKAFVEAQDRLDGVIILGGEITWTDATPHFLKSSIRWDAVAQSAKPIGLAVRVAPFPGGFNETNAKFIIEVGRKLLSEAAEHQATISEFQLDYDCSQKNLAAYRTFLHSLGQVVRPTRFTITTLPAWLNEPEFPRLIDEVDGYVLQVHSVPAVRKSGNAALCDPEMAKSWTKKAARFGRSFSVALPTYRCLGGYDANGKLLGVAMDSVQPAWPGGTRVLEVGANADELAQLVRDWKHARPTSCKGLIWYRVPIETDRRNWRWPTFAAVVEGRAPLHDLAVASAGKNPIDLMLANNGEAEEQFTGDVTAEWSDAALVSSDAIAGWTVRIEGERAVFSSAAANALRLSPGERRVIGWLRYDRSTQPRLFLAETRAATR